MKITGKQAMKTVNTGVPSLEPNHSIASTSQAIGGVPSSTVTSGRDIIAAVIETPAVMPSTLPAAIANASPNQHANEYCNRNPHPHQH